MSSIFAMLKVPSESVSPSHGDMFATEQTSLKSAFVRKKQNILIRESSVQPYRLIAEEWISLRVIDICHQSSSLLDHLAAVLPEDIVLVERRVDGSHHDRASQYASGRICAQGGIMQFGIPAGPMPAGADGRPPWPLPLTGSITHTGAYAAAAVGARSRFRSMGIDAEMIGRVSRDLWPSIFLPEETEWILGLPALDQDIAATLIFSSKEAFYKCQYEMTRQWLEFTDVRIDVLGWHQGSSVFECHPVGRVEYFKCHGHASMGHFSFNEELVLTAFLLEAA